MNKFGVAQSVLLEKVLARYKQELFVEPETAKPPEVETNQSNQEPQGSGDTEEKPAEETERTRIVKCSRINCRRKGPTSCANKMCFLCCYDMRCTHKIVCAPHLKDSLRREEEDRYIESMLSSNQKPRPLSHFQESKFTASGQTVVIWSAHDFFRNPAFSDDTLNQERRKRQQRERMEKRTLARSGVDVQDQPRKRSKAV